MTRLRKRFSKNLKAIRKKRGLTQEQLAERLGITARYVQVLEGKNCPNVKLNTIDTLSKALRVSPSDFLAS